MTIKTTRSELLSALSSVVPAAATKSAIAILDGVVVHAAGGGISLRCTDLAVTASAHVPCEHGGESFVVVASTLRKAVDALPNGAVTLTTSDGRVAVRGGTSTTKLPTRPAADFPNTPTAPASGYAIKAATLRSVIGRVRHATKPGDQPNKDGMHFLVEMGKVTATATDGNCLARAWETIGRGERIEAMVPSAGVAAIMKSLDRCNDDEDVRVAVADRCIFVGNMSARLYEEKPLPADVVIKASLGKHEIRVRRDDLIAAVKRVIVTANQHASITLTCSDEGLTVSSASDVGDTRADLHDAAVPGDASIVVAAHLLMGQLDHVVEDEVCIRVKALDGMAPLLFESIGYTGIVMPMRP